MASLKNSRYTKEDQMATALPILEIEEPGTDLARKTVLIKLHLGLLGNGRKVSSSQVEGREGACAIGRRQHG
jgi:hypothetical protein